MTRTELLNLKDISKFKELLAVFSEAFEDVETYSKKIPNNDYLKEFLEDATHIVLTAVENGKVIGGLVAYEMLKFEQQRKEMYIYDIAVAKKFQGKGIGTRLIEELKVIAKQRGAYAVFVESEADDENAKKFYRKFTNTEILANHFTILIK